MTRAHTTATSSGRRRRAPTSSRRHLLTALSGPICTLLLVAGCNGEGDGRTDASTSEPQVTEPVAAEPEVTEPVDTEPVATTGAEAVDPLVGRGDVELVDDGNVYTEGPQWWAEDGVLLFTDYQLSTIYQVDGEEVTPFRTQSNAAHGLAVDPEGRLLATERETRRVTRTESDGTVTPLAERFEGALLNDPNDLTVRSDGTIYFTDPLFAEHEAELDFRGVFRIAPDGTLTAERRGSNNEGPNGIVLSPDEHLLYVSSFNDATVWAFDVADDGTLSEARTFVKTGDFPDGMAVDDAGNLFVATDGGVEVYAPDGKLWGTIDVRAAVNCTFGGADGRTLYITAGDGVFAVELAHPGPY